MTLPYPLNLAAEHGPLELEVNQLNLVVVRGPGAPGDFDGWLWLGYRTDTGTSAVGWSALVFPCATRPSWDALVASRDQTPLLAVGRHEGAWELRTEAVENGGRVSVLRCVRPVRVIVGREVPVPQWSRQIHLFESSVEPEFDGSLIIEHGAMPRLAQAIHRLQSLHGGARPLTLTLVEQP